VWSYEQQAQGWWLEIKPRPGAISGLWQMPNEDGTRERGSMAEKHHRMTLNRKFSMRVVACILAA